MPIFFKAHKNDLYHHEKNPVAGGLNYNDDSCTGFLQREQVP
jgi:hypothetical protein